MHIREIKIGDERQLLELIQEVENHSEYMLFEPGERHATIESQRKMIEAMVKDENSTMLVAEDKGKLVGYLLARGSLANRTKHSIYLVIGIRKEYRGQGIGMILFTEIKKWSLERKVHRLELTVAVENLAGIRLYQKMGYEVEGRKRDSLFIAGRYIDEYYMSKLIGAQEGEVQ
ncbi:GNAT family N-acetyltransferase [Bacillus sp. MRMR6]|uniref:GNAT family N-acetyltransferase n=1 Tax=Bacillus sp. MRMR6 TaxID=1928617 RepID=UPI000951837F|nr:GNAT family N-acetyltransferase [Bacillus sp. MRMR6]OLS36889.1 GNAT family N-acetyltransferase [Bacillus sp. MRMR6]